ncbi:tRNA preQ1(34) S-adenosylmethionine ribosyltransferase-isomerase QueA [bacterium]|nr:tRNA preQ1(34) S-adenosylmethionine ribosyltransferase-isomerase QueA [bacterium]
MKLSDFHYDVPEGFIAQHPPEKRGDSRLLVVDANSDEIFHRQFSDLLDYLDEGDVLVVNETKVFPARLTAIKEETKATVEIFLLRELEPDVWETLVKPARKAQLHNLFRIGQHLTAEVLDTLDSGGRIFRFTYEGDFNQIIDDIGSVPLPPYIKRQAEPEDTERYQSIFADKRGAVAAPTANLHFDDKIVEKIREKGVDIVPVLLHVGLGTFRPVTVEDITQHNMDSEYYEVSENAAAKINAAIDRGNRVIAVGTTAVRVLETAVSADGHMKAESGWTDIFIYPAHKFKIVDALVTNFHQPGSTLILLVSAFGGKDLILRAYNEAVAESYRFFSYGDAMLIIRAQE